MRHHDWPLVAYEHLLLCCSSTDDDVLRIVRPRFAVTSRTHRHLTQLLAAAPRLPAELFGGPAHRVLLLLTAAAVRPRDDSEDRGSTIAFMERQILLLLEAVGAPSRSLPRPQRARLSAQLEVQRSVLGFAQWPLRHVTLRAGSLVVASTCSLASVRPRWAPMACCASSLAMGIRRRC
jgi:hypothetical protein